MSQNSNNIPVSHIVGYYLNSNINYIYSDYVVSSDLLEKDVKELHKLTIGIFYEFQNHFTVSGSIYQTIQSSESIKKANGIAFIFGYSFH